MELEGPSVPGWDDDVYIREFSGLERDAFESDIRKANDPDKNVRAMLVSRSLCDEKGNLLFNGPAEALQLGGASGKVLDMLFDLVRDLNGMGEDAQKSAEENSDGDPPASSP